MPSIEFADRARGALLGTMVGDAVGMPYEGTPREAVPETLQFLDVRLGRGTYTDDTEMTIALAESLVRCEVVDEEDLTASFSAAHDPRRGYGAGTLKVFELVASGLSGPEAARRLFDGRGSLGNGAAMRVAPVAVRFCDDSVILDAQARRSATVTHAHPVGVDGAAVQAAAVAAALEDRDPVATAVAWAQTREMSDALDSVSRACATGLEPEALTGGTDGIPPTAPPAVAAAVVIGARCSSFAEAVTLAVRCGGDTDTAAAMAGAIAGARFGARRIPREWLEEVENGERGRDHVAALASELAARAESAVVRVGRGR